MIPPGGDCTPGEWRNEMKIRWSDEHKYATEFECENENDFYQAAMPALADAREHTMKRYHHQGKNEIYFCPLSLHVMGVDGSWLGLSTVAGHLVFAADGIETSLENMLAGDEFWLSIDQYILYAYCDRTFLWSQEFERFCNDVGNMIMEEDKKIQNGKQAIEQFEKMIKKGK